MKNETSPSTTKNLSEEIPQHTVLDCACRVATSDGELGEDVHDPVAHALSYLTAVITYSYRGTASVTLKPHPLLSVSVCLEIHSTITQRKYGESSQSEACETC
jgi:hypothetical protein